MVKQKILICTIFVCILIGIFGCSEVGVLYATWSDSSGNTIMLNAQNNYTAKIYSEDTDDFVESIGTYVQNFNTIVFTDSSEEKSYAEWDIRNKILYLTFTDSSSDSYQLALYRVGDPVNTGEEE